LLIKNSVEIITGCLLVYPINKGIEVRFDDKRAIASILLKNANYGRAGNNYIF